jgi:hypothetical protein
VLRSLERATGDGDPQASSTTDLTEFDLRRALADLDESAAGSPDAATRRPVTLRSLHDFLD